MDIVIYGCGAIGSVLASLIKLSRKGNNHIIHLIGRSKLMKLISERGLYYVPYNSEEGIKTTGYNTYTEISEINKADVIFLTMKATSLESSLISLKKLISEQNPYIVISMNGLGLVDIVEKFVPKEKILEISVGYPSTIKENKVKNSGGNSFFVLSKNKSNLRLMDEIFGLESKVPIGKNGELKDLPFKFEEDFKLHQWKKGIANISINGVAAISMQNVGGVLERKTLRYVIEELVNESVKIADKLDIKLPDNIYNWLIDFASKDPNHKPSTYQDILKNKDTEVPFFNGFIVEKGKLFEIETPANLAILNLMNIIENGMKSSEK